MLQPIAHNLIAKETAGAKPADPRIDAAARDFEAMFLGEMLQHMFEGVETDGMFGGGQAEDIYRSMMVDEYSKIITKAGGVGVADHIKRELIHLQEKGS